MINVSKQAIHMENLGKVLFISVVEGSPHLPTNQSPRPVPEGPKKLTEVISIRFGYLMRISFVSREFPNNHRLMFFCGGP